jgi:GT2 family glycosyltransferase
MISLVIPVYNEHEMTALCLDTVRANTQDYEIVVIDNGSDPPIKGATVRNETNIGVPKAFNQGIQASKGDVIVILCNDVFVTPGWADRLLKHLDTFAIVAPVTVFGARLQRVQLPFYSTIDELNQRVREWQENPHPPQEVNWIIGFCMAFKRSLYDELGPFLDDRWPCSGEDIDYCFRARKAGYKVGIAHDVYVHHEGSKTCMAMHKTGEINYPEMCEREHGYLAKRWDADFWNNQEIKGQ